MKNRNHALEPKNPMYIGSAGMYVLITLILHGIYGAILGWLNPETVHFSQGHLGQTGEMQATE